MVRQSIRYALLFGAITAVAVSSARASASCNSSCGNAPCGPATRTITTWECVPETYQVKRISYKVECKTEEYDTFRCETVPEVRERQVKCIKRVPVMTTEIRKVAHKVTVNEERTIMKTSYRTVEETVMQKRLVRLGHWENREYTPLFSGLGNGGLFGGHGCNNSCDACAPACKPVKCRKVWVYCPVYECCPVKVCKKVCVQEPCKVIVPVCKTICKEEAVQVCTYKCVEECRTEKYTVCVTRKVPCKATRTVRVCVPVEETVNCTRYVRKCVTREVACPAANNCGNACETSCCNGGLNLRGRFAGLFAKKNDCCETRCDAGCCR